MKSSRQANLRLIQATAALASQLQEKKNYKAHILSNHKTTEKKRKEEDIEYTAMKN